MHKKKYTVRNHLSLLEMLTLEFVDPRSICYLFSK